MHSAERECLRLRGAYTLEERLVGAHGEAVRESRLRGYCANTTA